MIATEDIAKGCEVVNCYGHLSNAELLRGYGYVEKHNSHRHVQVPAQFLIRAAAGALPASHQAGSEAVGGASKCSSQITSDNSQATQQQEQPQQLEGELAVGTVPGGPLAAVGATADADNHLLDDHLQQAEDSEDEEADSEGDVSESESDEEPDWDLEDDSEDDSEDDQEGQRKQQRQQHVGGQNSQTRAAPSLAHPPSLTAAQLQITDWEDRWRLCFQLKLLPRNGVFQAPAGGPSQLPGQLLSVLLLLLADAQVCQHLAAAIAGAAQPWPGQLASATDTECCEPGGDGGGRRRQGAGRKRSPGAPGLQGGCPAKKVRQGSEAAGGSGGACRAADAAKGSHVRSSAAAAGCDAQLVLPVLSQLQVRDHHCC
jgi:hypothetical protein